MAENGLRSSKQDLLGDSERRILVALACGDAYSEISESLSLSEHALNYIIKNICDKLSVQNLRHAIAVAMRDKIILPDEIT